MKNEQKQKEKEDRKAEKSRKIRIHNWFFVAI